MDREDVLDRINIVAPALSDQALIPILTHVWFTGSQVMAFNDTIAIATPFKTEFSAAVPNTLIDLLKSSKAKDIDFDYKDDKLHVKAASSRFKLPTFPKTNFIFAMPKADSQPWPEKQFNEFLDGLEAVMRSVGKDAAVVEQLGVTVMIDGNTVDLFATNSVTISHAVVALPKQKKRRVILPTEFCKQLLAIGRKGAKAVTIDLADKHIVVKLDQTTLFGRLLETETPLDFMGVCQRVYPGFLNSNKGAVAVPTKLEGALDRACIIAQSKASNPNPTKTKIIISADKLTLTTESDHGVVTDTIALAEKHAVLGIAANPNWLSVGMVGAEKMLFNDKCCVMIKGETEFLVSCYTLAAQKE